MNTLKNLFKQYLWLFVLIAVAFVGISTFLVSTWYQEKSFDKTVSTQTNQANSAVRESETLQSAAANYSIERRAEDALREKVIVPKLDEARRRSSNSKSQVQTAQKEYENAKTNVENLNRSLTDNCAELIRLYPNVQFEYCSKR